MTLTTCVMPHGYRDGITGAICGQPVAPEYHASGPWMCAECRAESERRLAAHRAVFPSSYVPAVADVYRIMRDTGAEQEAAVAIATAAQSLMTTAEAAAELGISPVTVRWHCAQRNLGTKLGRDLFLSRADVEAIRARVGQGGRPRTI